MRYMTIYKSPIDDLILTSDGEYLTGIIFSTSQAATKIELKDYLKDEKLDVFKKTKSWLTKYFNQEQPSINEIPIKLTGSEFSMMVFNILKYIPYGKTTTYGSIANIISKRLGIKRMSSQAVGNAIGRNPIPIIIPCHRVIGSKGNLTGYSPGIDKKIYLLNHEKIKFNKNN